VKIIAVISISLVLLVSAIQATHVHTEDSKIPSHECTMCSVAHAGILNHVIPPPAPLFVQTSPVVVSEPISNASGFVSSLHIRPPPAV
jgi:hypothetical protein